MTATDVRTSPDFEAIKTRQRAIWSSGDYGAVAAGIHFMSELLVETVDIHAGQFVLDVATGTGNAAIAAARRGANVVGIDYAPVLLEKAQRRADAEGLSVEFKEMDAEALTCRDGRWDVVVSVVGVMFAPNQAQAANQLVRVCRPGGLIAIANWTPDGFIGELLRLVGSFVAPPPGLTPPTFWGTREGTSALLGHGGELSWIDRTHAFRFGSAEEFAEFFITNYGPTERAHALLDASAQQEFRDAVIRLAGERNVATDGTLVVPSTYLETYVRVS